MSEKGVLLALAIASFLLVGCAQAAPPDSGATVSEVKAGDAGLDPSRCEPGKEWWRAPGPAVRGGVAVMAANDITHGDLTTLDRGNRPGWRVYQELLVTRGCYSGDITVVPYLAKSWDISSDGLTWTLKIQDNVRWHNKPPLNGRAFTSADVTFPSAISSRAVSPAAIGQAWRAPRPRTPRRWCCA